MEFAELNSFHFLRPWWLLTIIPVLGSFLYVRSIKKANSEWQKIIAPQLLKVLTVKGGSRNWFNPNSAIFLLTALAVIVSAGPSWERKPSPFVEDEASLVIALELSGSMNQEDVQPSRLSRVKQKIEDLLVLRGGAKTGLIVYSGTAHTVIPLTNDPEIIRQFLRSVNPEMMPQRGKFPEKVLPLANRMLSESHIPASILLVADGVGTQSTQAFADFFENSPHQLLVLGVGLEAYTPKPSDNSSVHLPIQKDELKELSSLSHGSYHDITIDKDDVIRLNRRINHHMANVDDGNRPWIDGGYPLVFPLALLLLLWFRKGWTLKWCLVLCVIGGLNTPSTLRAAEMVESHAKQSDKTEVESFVERAMDSFVGLWMTDDQRGRYYFERGEYEQAAHYFKNIEWKAMAFYYQEDFTAAAELLTQVDTITGLFNLSNAYAQGKNYVLSRGLYEKVLEQQADHAGAQKNLLFIKKIIADIDRMSQSQQAETGEQSKELDDAPRRSDGADREMIQDKEVKQYSAEQILTNKALHEMWMRQVQQDPSNFLSVKFQMQVDQPQPAKEAEVE